MTEISMLTKISSSALNPKQKSSNQACTIKAASSHIKSTVENFKMSGRL